MVCYYVSFSKYDFDICSQFITFSSKISHGVQTCGFECGNMVSKVHVVLNILIDLSAARQVARTMNLWHVITLRSHTAW